MSKQFKHMILLTAVIVLIDISRAASADISFFLQPEGTGQDGEAHYLNTIATNHHLGSYELIDFDDLSAFPVESEVHALEVDSVEFHLGASLATSILAGNGHTGPYIFNPHGFYIWEGKAFMSTLVMGDQATLEFDSDDDRAGAVGFWIFDDQRSLDSVYRIDVMERCGQQATTILANDMPPNIEDVYEIEGFVGIISDVGIRRIVVTPLDPWSLLPQSDIFEIDTLTIGRLHVENSCDEDDSSDSSEDAALDDDSANSNEDNNDSSDDGSDKDQEDDSKDED
ncbi:MAG: hypothetical protein ACE5EQ_11465 [Phycisphaerae bacterium]